MKKILSLVLVIAMMASLVVFAAPAASADETVYTVEVTDATAVAGDKVSVDVMVTGTTMYMFGFAIEYDATRLANPVIKTNSDLFGAGGAIAGADYQASWNSNANDTANGVDVSEATKVLTITFDVLDNPGDAYVKCAPFKNDSKIYIGETDTKATGAKYDWTAIDGKVSILPKGYTVGVPEAPASDFTYTIVDANNATITAYNGSASEVMFPSFVPDDNGTLVPVTKIGTNAFVSSSNVNNTTVTKVIIPETVTEIENYALINLTNCYEVHVYNPDMVIGDYSIGYAGATYSSKKKTWSYTAVALKTMTGEDGDPIGSVVIHCFENSTAYNYTQEFDPDYYLSYSIIDALPTVVTVVAGDTTSAYEVSGDQIAAPGAAIVDGKPVVAWKVNGAAVLPGAAVAINGDTTFEAMTVDMATVNGASMKVTEVKDELALRFTATINIADYEEIVEAFEGATISHGMLIVPQQYVARAGGFTHAALENLGKGYLDFEMSGCYEMTSTDYVLAANVKGFKDATLTKNPKFNAVGYIAIKIGNETTYVYSNYSTATSRDLKSVAMNAQSSYVGTDAWDWLNAIINYKPEN